MARTTKELTALEVERTKPGTAQKKLYDGRGLLLIVTPAGGKWWRFNYSFSGKSKTISCGTYPEVSLAQAREKREEARKLLATGIALPQTERPLKQPKRNYWQIALNVSPVNGIKKW